MINGFIRRRGAAWAFLAFAAWLSLAHCLSEVVAAPVDVERPNVILILADDVGREVLSCYGGTSHQTPNIDRLAAGGVRFTHAFVMPVCHPTRICLLTGKYPFRLGNPLWGTFPAEAESRTVAQVLKSAGYATAVAGKWQLGLLKDDLEQPRRLGFDEYCLLGWHEGPWYYHPHIWQNGQRRTDVADRYGPDVIHEYVNDFISRHRSRPFVAFYSMSHCHSETNDLEHPAPVGPHGRYDNFAEMVVKMDDNVGSLMQHLEMLGLRDKTLVLYLADNGTAARSLIDAEGDEYVYETITSRIGDREIPGGKATLTDWGTRVPLIVSWPGRVGPGRVSEMLVDASDVLPSLANAASAALPKGFRPDGRSILGHLRGSAAAGRRWVFSEHNGRSFVRNDRWKLYSDGQFFESEADPDEHHPLTERALSADEARAHRELTAVLHELGLDRQ